jgi:hypothetical protein
VRESLLSYWLLAALLVHAGSHVALLVGLLRSPPIHRGFVALLLPPLAPYYGWRRGWRKRTFMWLGGLLAYAVGVVLANVG